MNYLPLDNFDIQMSKAKRSYLAEYGWCFNKKACDCAVKEMYRKNAATGKKERIEPTTKDQVEEILKKNNIVLEHNRGYDFVYVFNMAKADYWKSAIEDDAHLAKFVKDAIDDPDNPGGNWFRKYYADCVAKGTPIDWDEIL